MRMIHCSQYMSASTVSWKKAWMDMLQYRRGFSRLCVSIRNPDNAKLSFSTVKLSKVRSSSQVKKREVVRNFMTHMPTFLPSRAMATRNVPHAGTSTTLIDTRRAAYATRLVLEFDELHLARACCPPWSVYQPAASFACHLVRELVYRGGYFRSTAHGYSGRTIAGPSVTR